MNKNILDNIYRHSLLENERNIRFWEDYLKNLNALDFNVYSDKLTVPVLVPLGNKILFRGALKHTNEVLVPLGADYFTKCSIKQAEILRQHRIKDAKAKLESYSKEKEYLENQLSFSKENVYDNYGQDIIETCTEEEDKAWREQHREKVRQYYQNKNKKQEVSKETISDEELWLRLEELELQEEMENEFDNLNKTEVDESDASSYDSFIIKEDDVSNTETEEKSENNINVEVNSDKRPGAKITRSIPKQTSKYDLLHQAIDRQKSLETTLMEIKNRQRIQCKTENDLVARLEEMEQLDELEDEMERLDDILEESDNDNNEDNEPITNNASSSEIKRSVSFADKDDCETLEITFKHSSVEPSKEPYNEKLGITKPSDVYKVYSNLFTNETTSILRKSRYGNDLHTIDQYNNNILETEKESTKLPSVNNNNNVGRTIVVKDVIEKTSGNDSRTDTGSRPTSLFKKRRQQQKS